ncbi:MAG TPA: hypothetical protein PK954_03915 [Anaerolineales bacterium]|nr:hypothetical protein [Anaerolineales bacterium]
MLKTTEIGTGQVHYDADLGRARLAVAPSQAYADAQLDNYQGLQRRRLPDRAPTGFLLRARASHAAPPGTLGFGYWNDPFTLLSGDVLAAPSAAWFLYASPPADMALAENVPGHGWKAATLNAGRWPSWLIGPAAAGAIALTRVPGLGAPVMRLARRYARAHEQLLTDVALDVWHTYRLAWRTYEVVFWVDGVERLRTPAPPAGPLGFVLWIDNQYAIASRDGRFGFGVLPVETRQWLEIEDLAFEP